MIQFCFRQKTYRFTLKKSFFLWCLFFFVLFCVLAHWQLHRYHYKKELYSTYQKRLTAPPTAFLNLNMRSERALQFQRVVVEGQYLNALTMFVQNQVYKNRMGFEVLTPLKISGTEKLLLVDRGWVPQIQENSNMLPKVHEAVSSKVTGYIKLLNEYQFILGDNILNSVQSPLVMQKINTHQLSQLTHKSFYPFILRLNASAPDGFVRDWIITSTDPQRHLGYAVQWLLMAIALFIAYVNFSCERVRENDFIS